MLIWEEKNNIEMNHKTMHEQIRLLRFYKNIFPERELFLS